MNEEITIWRSLGEFENRKWPNIEFGVSFIYIRCRSDHNDSTWSILFALKSLNFSHLTCSWQQSDGDIELSINRFIFWFRWRSLWIITRFDIECSLIGINGGLKNSNVCWIWQMSKNFPDKLKQFCLALNNYQTMCRLVFILVLW